MDPHSPKGPVWLIGLVLVAFGVTALIFGGHGFAQHVPTGAVHGKTWLGLDVNGWSGLLFITAALLLLGAPTHWGAKGMLLIVGVALVAACLIALANGHGALGLFAANGLTELVWAAAGALLVVLSLLPRVGGKTKRSDDLDLAGRHPAGREVESEPGTVEPARGAHARPPATRLPANGTLTSARGVTTAYGRTLQGRPPRPNPIDQPGRERSTNNPADPTPRIGARLNVPSTWRVVHDYEVE